MEIKEIVQILFQYGGTVIMADMIYWFKEDKCKVPVGTIIHH